MNVGTIRLRDGRRVRASPSAAGPVAWVAPPAGGPAPRASSWTDGPTWLRTRWSRAVFTVGASAVVGIAAGAGPKYAVAALLGVALVVIVLARPVIGAYTLVALVPPVSGLRAGLPVPQFRLSEVLVASV